jgi:hypoxanthine phosphoribosyltransferase
MQDSTHPLPDHSLTRTDGSAMTTLAEALAVYEKADVLHPRERVEAALDRLAREITAALGDKTPIVLSVMLGGLIPAGKLIDRFTFPLELDYVHATRYAGATSGGELRWIAKPGSSLLGRTVLLVDDILDEGLTLAAIHQSCLDMGASQVHSAVLIEKNHQRKNGYQATFVGLQVEDRYVFGYGMDYKGYFRNAPGIYAVSDNG